MAGGVVRHGLEVTKIGSAAQDSFPAPCMLSTTISHEEILEQELLGQDDVMQLEFPA